MSAGAGNAGGGVPGAAAGGPPSGQRSRFNGWFEAALFALALSVLNVSYAFGFQQGVQPVAFLVWAMPVAAFSLLAVSGLGADWRQVIAHPLSLVVGAGIIAMEAVYYVLLTLVTPTDGSVLVRLGVPIAMGLGLLLGRGRPAPVAILGGLSIVAGIGWYVPRMETAVPLTSLALGAACGAIMSGRSFAAEYHPWNRQARTIIEKMRVTGLMLLVTSVVGTALVVGAVGGAAHGLIRVPAWLPTLQDLTYPPAIGLGFFVGMLVLTAMQYLGFSVVVKIGTESFLATTALIPIVTLAVQEAAVRIGLLAPVAIDWRVLPVMGVVVAGVFLVILGNRRRR